MKLFRRIGLALALALSIGASAPGCGTINKFIGSVDGGQVAASYAVVSAVLRDASGIALRNKLIDADTDYKIYKELNRADGLVHEGNIGIAKILYFSVQGMLPPSAVSSAEVAAGTTIDAELAKDGVAP